MLLLFACAEPVALQGEGAPDPGAATEPAPETLPDPCATVEHEPLRINELVAANLDSATDEDGDSPDWFELWSPASVALRGWVVGDGSSKWSFPDIFLQADTELLVFASEKDRAGPELHTDFALDADAAELHLYAPDGCEVDATAPGRLYGDVAWGRNAEGWGYFLEPTPGAPNDTESRPGFAETPRVSPESGIQADLVVSVSGEGHIYVAEGGRVPDEEDRLYTAPFEPEGDPVVLRARAFVDGLWPSRVATASWFRADPGYEVPLHSLVLDPPDLWDEETGIYAYGDSFEPHYPYFGANFWEDWEKEAHLDLVQEGELRLSTDLGVSIHGGYTRAFDQKSFRLAARSAYGASSLEAPLFPSEPYESYAGAILQLGSDFCSTNLFDAFGDRLFRLEDGSRPPELDVQAYAPAAVWLNGAFWGFYGLRERLDHDWIVQHYGEEDVDRIKVGWTHDANWTLEEGSWEAFDTLNSFAAGADLSDPDQWASFEAMVEPDNLAATTLAVGWMANADWWWNNLRLWRPREGRFRWMVFDLGHGWPAFGYDHLATSMTYNGTGLPIGAALQNEAFRQRFVLMGEEWLASFLSAPVARARLEQMIAEVDTLMPDHQEHWCGTGAGAWASALDYARTYVDNRPGEMRDDLQAHFGLAEPVRLTLEAEPAEAGAFRLSFVSVESGFSGLFFPGVPVSITAEAAPGWVFDGWSDGGADAARSLDPQAEATLTALFSPA